MEKEYKIDNEAQLDKALKYLDTLGYEWMSGDGLTDWKPDTTADDFPIVLTTGIFSQSNTVTHRLLIGSGNDHKPPFDNLLDAPDYSEETDAVTEEGQTASEIFSEFLGELTELLGLTEDEGLEFGDEPEDDEDTLADISNRSDKTKFIIRLTNRRVVWRVPNDLYMDISGPKNGFELRSKEGYSINPYWDYHLTVEELAEALSLIDLSELASISIID